MLVECFFLPESVVTCMLFDCFRDLEAFLGILGLEEKLVFLVGQGEMDKKGGREKE